MENARLSPILDDQPAEEDHLKFTSYVRAFKRQIVHKDTKTPLTLGIFGRWGTGKTTLMQMLEKELMQEGVATVWFDAWQYSREDELWAAFLQSVLNRLHADLNFLRRLAFKIRLLRKRIKWRDLSGVLIPYLIRMIVVIIPLLLIDPVSQQFRPEAVPLVQASGGVIALGLAIWIVIKPLVEAVRQNVTIDFSAFYQKSDYQEHIAFLDKFREHFFDVVHSLPQRGDKRLAVFIDDLDRCSSERALEVLDAIKLFVDIRGCIYILGLDIDVVQDAVAIKYPKDPVAQREYMGKIIQLPFHLPPLTRDDMGVFLEHLAIELPDQRCREVFMAGLMFNPREIKRTINIFSLLWTMAAEREDLMTVIQPVRLAKIVVIQHSYPDLHKILQDRPHLLIELERFFRQRQALEARRRGTPEVGEVEEDHEQPIIELPPELQSYAQSEALRRMFLLYDLPDPADNSAEDEVNFVTLKRDEVAVYFTLTSRAEAPKVVEATFAEVAIDRSFSGRYRIIEELGRGGFATVYLAQDLRTERRVAVKVLEPHLARESLAVERFKREGQLLYGLNHSNIVRIYDHGETDDGQPYIVMDYLSGGDLSRMIQNKGFLTVEETMGFAIPILNALGYLHKQNIVHRDVKPSAILFDDQGSPKLSDLGIAWLGQYGMFETFASLTQSGLLIGTPAYMAPEQAAGTRGIDSHTDLYGFGVVLYECLTGQTPFSGNNLYRILQKITTEPPPPLREVKPDLDIPEAVERVVLKLLEKNPDDRYQSAGEVIKALREATGQAAESS